MTFCVGVGCSNIGLVAADTRCKTEDGLISDDGELRFKNPSGGRSLVLPSQYRKIRRLDGGWVTVRQATSPPGLPAEFLWSP